MIRSLSIFCASIIVCGILLFTPRPIAQPPQPIFYIIHTEVHLNVDKTIRIVMDYAMNGQVQTQSIFYSEVEREAFLKHLDFLGSVYGY